MTLALKCLSHTPLRGLNDPSDAIAAEVEAALAKARAEVEAFDPELIVIFAPDHYNGLFYDLMPPFVVGFGAESVGDYQTSPGPLAVPEALAQELAAHVLESEVDIAVSHRLSVDHGCAQTLEELTGSLTRYPVIPIIINSVAPPFAPYRRIGKLGEAVGRFAAGLGKRVLILGSGGLSHEPPVPLIAGADEEVRRFLIAGRNPSPEGRDSRQARTLAVGRIYGTADCSLRPLNPEWDQRLMDLFVTADLAAVNNFGIEEVARLGGRSAHEIRCWLAAFSALAAAGPYTARKDYYRPIDAWIAGYGIVSGESLAPASTPARQGAPA